MNYQSSNYRPNTQASIFPPAVKHLLIINVLVFIAMWTPKIGPYIQHFGMLYPLGSGQFHIWQLVSYMFLHASIGHIFFNLFALWMFGQSIENLWGTRRFTIFYLLTGIGAALLHMFISGGNVPMLGASGAVYGILLAFGMMFPNRRIMLLFPPIPIKAKYFVAIFGVIEFISGISRTDNVANFAHLGGMLVGFILIKLWGLKGESS